MKETKEKLYMVLKLSIPAILAQISSVIMQYIDAAMVGNLGANASASIGMVASSTWLIGGICISIAMGFAVQVSQFIGAKQEEEAQNVLRQSIVIALAGSLVLAAVGIGISGSLPVWLGGAADIQKDASAYFMVYSCALPAVLMRQLCGNMLQCSGDMKIAGVLNASMCGFDIVFNAFLIFPSREMTLFGGSIKVPGAGLGVVGAAIGTALAEVVVAIWMLYMVCIHSKSLRLRKNGSWKLKKLCMKRALSIALPMAFERTILCGAQVTITRIVAPLGTIAVAANSLAVTAESICYMPGFGISSAATALVGQSMGAEDKEQAKMYARTSVFLGVVLMSAAGALMFLLAPAAFRMLTSNAEVQQLGVKVLRIELLAEPFFAMSIVAAGALRGAGDTFVPSILNLVSMWGVRVTAAVILTPKFGLTGVWIAMCIELCVRGIIFQIRLMRGRWLEKSLIQG